MKSFNLRTVSSRIRRIVRGNASSILKVTLASLMLFNWNMVLACSNAPALPPVEEEPNCCGCEPEQGCEQCDDDGNPMPGMSPDPVYLFDGAAIEEAVDLTVPGVTNSWAMRRTYNSTNTGIATTMGSNWLGGLTDMRLTFGASTLNSMTSIWTSKVALLVNASSQIEFTVLADSANNILVNPAVPADTDGSSLVLSAVDEDPSADVDVHVYLTNTKTNDKYEFYVFSDPDNVLNGRLKKQGTRQSFDASTPVYNEYFYDSLGRPDYILLSNGYLVDFDYGASFISRVQVKSGSTVLEQVEYKYKSDYDNSTTDSDVGTSDDLVQVIVSKQATGDSSGALSIVRRTQYRYDGSSRLKAVFENDAIYRITQQTGNSADNILTLANSDTVGSVPLSSYASRSFDYYAAAVSTVGTSVTMNGGWTMGATQNLHSDYTNGVSVEVNEAGLVKSESVGASCSSCGSGSDESKFTRYYYYLGLSKGTNPAQNEVVRIVIEDTVGSDGLEQFRTIYGLNKGGRILRKAVVTSPLSSPSFWCESWILDDSGTVPNSRLAEYRKPSAHNVTTSNIYRFLNPYDDVSGGWGNDSYTFSGGGLISTYKSNAGGNRVTELVQEGTSGTPHCVSATDYSNSNPDGVATATYTYQVATTLANRATGIKTEYAYEFYDSDNRQIKKKTTTLPIVTASSPAHNGSGVATVTVEYYDTLGRIRWIQDGEGYITYRSYNSITGGLALEIRDVNPASPGADVTGTSNEWDAWTVGGADSHKPTRGTLPTAIALTTKTYYDALGRVIKRVDSGSKEHYTVYKNTQTIEFPYWTGSAPLLPIRVTVKDDGLNVSEVYQVKATYSHLATSGGMNPVPLGFDPMHIPTNADYVSWTKYSLDEVNGRVNYIDRYHDTAGTTIIDNYYRTVRKYDPMGHVEFLVDVISKSGSNYQEQITHFHHDALGRQDFVAKCVSDYSHDIGADYDNYPALITVSADVYDGGGIGDGYVTKRTKYFGSSSNDLTGVNYKYDYRGRLRGMEPFHSASGTPTPHSPYTVQDFDFAGNLLARAEYATQPTWSGGMSSVLGTGNYTESVKSGQRTLQRSRYDVLGRVYQSETVKVDPSTGADSGSIVTEFYFDRNGRLVAQEQDYGSGVEFAYDGVGRRYQHREVLVLNSTHYSSGAYNYCAPIPNPALGSSGGDNGVMVLNHSTYDQSGNRTSAQSLEANHNESSLGIHLGNNDYVRTTQFFWYDGVNRMTTMADYGSGTSTWTYVSPLSAPSIPPVTGPSVLVTLMSYDPATGRPDETIDPAGKKTKTWYDSLNRRTYVADNYSDFNGSSGTGDSTDKSKDQVVRYQYDGFNNVIALTAMDADADGNTSDNQVTQYVYDDPIDAHWLRSEIYPDSSGSSDKILREYNYDGSVKKKTDQRGTVIEYTYDENRRLKREGVTTLGGADNHIQSIDREYDGIGLLTKVTSYANNNGTGTVRNQVQMDYDGLGQVVNSYQSHEGIVYTSGGSPSRKVVYTYDDSTASDSDLSINVLKYQHRLISTTYPNNRVAYLEFDTSHPDAPASRFSRVQSIRNGSGGTTWTSYEYNGRDRLVTADYPQISLKLDYYQGTTGTYAGFDQFGRVKDQRWTKYSASLDLDRFGYGYDYAGNRTYRDIDVAVYSTNDKDQAFTYDGLHRLKNAKQGSLLGTTISTSPPKWEQNWATLDALGNWKSFVTKDASGATVMEQTRGVDNANKLTSITKVSGSDPAWAPSSPGYDSAGSMTSGPWSVVPNVSQSYVYDAWNRLVSTTASAFTVTYEYDGLNRRIIQSNFGGVFHSYYNEDWQELEVRKEVSGSEDPDPLEQFLWHPYYIDALATRFYDSTMSGTQTQHYFTHDANYNMTSAVNTSGGIVERYDYTPYGAQSVLTASFGSSSGSIGNAYGYTGRRFDSVSGIYYYRNRFYDAGLGMFLSRDPMGYSVAQENLYNYVHSIPTNRVDPLGLCDLFRYSYSSSLVASEFNIHGMVDPVDINNLINVRTSPVNVSSVASSDCPKCKKCCLTSQLTGSARVAVDITLVVNFLRPSLDPRDLGAWVPVPFKVTGKLTFQANAVISTSACFDEKEDCPAPKVGTIPISLNPVFKIDVSPIKVGIDPTKLID